MLAALARVHLLGSVFSTLPLQIMLFSFVRSVSK